MAHWPISKKIKSLGLLSLVLLMMVAVVGIGTSLRQMGLFSEFFRTASFTITANKIVEDMAEANAAVVSYRISANEMTADIVRKDMVDVSQKIGELLDAIAPGSAEVSVLTALQGHSHSYLEEFEVTASLVHEREADLAKMLVSGSNASGGLEELSKTALDAGDQASVLFYIGDAQQHLLSGRLLMERYLQRDDEAVYQEAMAHIDHTKIGIDRLSFLLTTPARIETVKAIKANIEEYHAAAEHAFATIQEQNLHYNELSTFGQEILHDVDTYVENTVDHQIELGTSGRENGRLAAIILSIVSIASACAMLALNRRVSKGITQSIEISVGEMRALAEGDLNTEPSNTEAETELGEMARTLVVFRDTAIESRNLREEQHALEQKQNAEQIARTEKEATAEAERQAAVTRERQAVLRTLSESLGSVVDAAAAGDFSHRIGDTFDDPEINGMAASINRLLEAIDIGIGETARVMELVSCGDLTKRMEGDFSGRFSELQSSVNNTVDVLGQLVAEIASQSSDVGEGSAAMTDQAEELAQRAERQAAALEETSAAMHQMTGAAQSSARDASDATRIAEDATQKVDVARTVVSSAVSAMTDIRQASERIGEIVSVIDGIAFQTNLLALNASVEAARAGSAGKGFAVVASEVRALAQRSGEASKDISGLIDESATQVERGVGLVEQTGTTLEDIVSGVIQMAEKLSALKISAEDQSASITEVSSAIAEMDKITQNNAALADTSRGAAGLLRHQTKAMQELVGQFKTTDASEVISTIAAE